MTSAAGTAGGAAAERAAGRRAGVVGLASIGLSIAALAVANAASGSSIGQPGTVHVDQADVDRQKQLVDFASSTDLQAVAAVLRSAGLLLCVPVGLYLIWLIGRRGGVPSRWARWSLLIGPPLVVAATFLGFFAFKDVADAYVASGARTTARAGQLIDDSGTLKAAGVVDLGSRVVFAFWVGLLSQAAMRVGLLTSFLGYWGIAAAGALVILPIGDAMFLSWVLSIAILALGYWPGGRPEAWERRAEVEGPALI